MGVGLGHIMAIRQIASAMLLQGNRVTCILKDMSHAADLLSQLKINCLLAPRVPFSNRRSPSINHAQLLHRASYETVEKTATLLREWRSLFDGLRPDRVVCDYSPTAALVARSMGIEVVAVDNGFSMPPVSEDSSLPLPAIRAYPQPAEEQLAEAESEVLGILNTALAQLGYRPLEAFSSLFSGKVLYRNWSELNHFKAHSADRHIGALVCEFDGPAPAWPPGKGRKLFAYLKHQHPATLPILLNALRLGFRVCAYLPGMPTEQLMQLTKYPHFRHASQPFNLSLLPDNVDIGVWHSPVGAVARSLEKGMKMIFLPMHAEQDLACAAVLRAGISARVCRPGDNLQQALEGLDSAPLQSLSIRLVPADVETLAHKLVYS